MRESVASGCEKRKIRNGLREDSWKRWGTKIRIIGLSAGSLGREKREFRGSLVERSVVDLNFCEFKCGGRSQEKVSDCEGVCDSDERKISLRDGNLNQKSEERTQVGSF